MGPQEDGRPVVRPRRASAQLTGSDATPFGSEIRSTGSFEDYDVGPGVTGEGDQPERAATGASRSRQPPWSLMRRATPAGRRGRRFSRPASEEHVPGREPMEAESHEHSGLSRRREYGSSARRSKKRADPLEDLPAAQPGLTGTLHGRSAEVPRRRQEQPHDDPDRRRLAKKKGAVRPRTP